MVGPNTAWRYALLSFAAAAHLAAAPTGFCPVSGDAVIVPTLNSRELLIQTGQKTAIQWETFSIAPEEIVNFSQADASAKVFNFVKGHEMSELLGKLHSNGSVFLINPNGILIDKGAEIKTAGFLASTHDLFQGDLDDQLRFIANSDQGVVNRGSIRCSGGDVFLIGKTVENTGSIESARIALLSGAEILIRPNDAPLVHIRSDEMLDQDNPYALAIRHTGSIRAREIHLEAASGMTRVSGELAAPGGTVRLLGQTVYVEDDADISASHETRGGELLIGGDFQGKNPKVKNATTTVIERQAHLKADALIEGNGGKVIVWADQSTLFYGNISAQGGICGGDGGFVEVSAKELTFRGHVTTYAPYGKAGTLLLDPIDVTIQSPTATTDPFSGCVMGTDTYAPITNASNVVLNTDITTHLGMCNVLITTEGSTGTGTGAIIVASSGALSYTSANTLTLHAVSYISIAGSIQNSGTGAIQIVSDGVFSSANTNPGIILTSEIQTAGGDILLFGQNNSPGNAGGMSGVFLQIGSSVIATNGGNIQIAGRCGAGTDLGNGGRGVIFSTLGSVTSDTGSITISGISSFPSTEAFLSSGVDLGSATISTAGTIFFGGTVTDPTTTSAAITGCQAGSSTTALIQPGVVIATALNTAGDVVFATCLGGTGSAIGNGVYITAPLTVAGALIATDNIVGSTLGAGFSQAAAVTVAGPITITASGSSSTSGSYGITISSGAMSTTGAGNAITLTGSASGTSAGGANGIQLTGGSLSTNNAPILLTGSASGTGAIQGIGILVGGTNVGNTSTTGSITFTGMSSSPGASSHGVSVQGAQSPATTSTITFLNCSGGTTGTQSHGVNIQATLNAAGSLVFATCTGGSGGTANGLNISAAVTATGNIIGTNLVGGSEGGFGYNQSATVTVNGAENIISITARGTGTASSSSGITISAGMSTGANAGSITLTGTGATSSASSPGINVSGLISTSLNNSTITLNGMGSGTAICYGVGISGNGAITSGSGIINLTGTSTATGVSSGNGSHGISIVDTWNALTTGTVTFIGSAAGSSAYGVCMGGATFTTGGSLDFGTALNPTTVGLGLSSGTIQSQNTMTFSSTLDALFAGQDSVILEAEAGNVVFTGNIGTNGALNALTINNTASAVFLDTVSSVIASSVTITSPTTTIFDGSTMTPTVIDTHVAGGNIMFGSDVNGQGTAGGHPVTLTAGAGTITFSGNVGNIVPLGDVLVETGQLALKGQTFSAASLTTDSVVPTTLGFVGTTNMTTSPGGITFNGTLNGTTAQSQSVSFTTAGDLSFQSNVGAGTTLGVIMVHSDSSSTTYFGASVSQVIASSLQVLSSPVVLQGTGSTTINTSSAVTGLISFGNTLDGDTGYAHALTLNAGTGGSVVFGAAVGSIVPIGALTITSAATTAGAVQIGGNITAAGFAISSASPAVLTANSIIDVSGVTNGSISFGGTIAASSAGAQNLTLIAQDAGTIQLLGNVGTTRLGAVDIQSLPSGTSTLTFGSAVATVAANSFTVEGAVNTVVTSSLTTITTNNGAISFGGKLNGALNDGSSSVTLTAGTGAISFGLDTNPAGSSNIGDSGLLGTFAITSANSTTGVNFAASVATIDVNTFSIANPIPVTFSGTGATTITASNGITFYGTVNGLFTAGGHAVTLDAGTSAVAFMSNIGQATRLGSLDIASGSSASFGANVSAITANSVTIGAMPTTFAYPDGTGPVVIDTSTPGGNILFSGALDGASSTPGSQLDLSLNAGSGDITFSDAVGSSHPLDTLLITNADNVTASSSITANAITQLAGSGTTAFNGDLTVTNDITLTGNAFSFNAPVTATNMVIANSGLLTIGSSAAILLSGYFWEQGPGLVDAAGSITTDAMSMGNDPMPGDIEFDTGVTLTDDLMLNATGTVTFEGTVNGPHALTIEAANVFFDSVVGTIALTSLDVSASGTITVNAAQTVSSGPMSYSGAVVITDTVEFTNNGSNPTTFDASPTAISGPFTCNIVSAGATVTVTGDIDLSSADGSAGNLTIEGFSVTVDGDISTQGATGGASLGSGGRIWLIGAQGSVTVGNINASSHATSEGFGGDIILSPVSTYSGGYPVGLLTLNGTLILSTGPSPSTGGDIHLTANRTAPATVATIVGTGDVNIQADSCTIDLYEAMTVLGDLVFTCPTVTLSDTVVLNNLGIFAEVAHLKIHGDETLLNYQGGFYNSAELHFLAGMGYVNGATLIPTGPLNAGVTPLTTELLMFEGHVLNYDNAITPPAPPSPPLPKQIQNSIYELTVADAQFFDLLPLDRPRLSYYIQKRKPK